MPSHNPLRSCACDVNTTRLKHLTLWGWGWEGILFFKPNTQVLLDAQKTRPREKRRLIVLRQWVKNSEVKNSEASFVGITDRGRKRTEKTITLVFLTTIAFLNKWNSALWSTVWSSTKHWMSSQPSYVLPVLVVSHLFACKMLWDIKNRKGAIENPVLFSHTLVDFQGQNVALGCTHAALAVAIGSFLHISAGITWALMLSDCSNDSGWGGREENALALE